MMAKLIKINETNIKGQPKTTKLGKKYLAHLMFYAGRRKKTFNT
ncbi:uncharacterized protein METZ01_LOCUS250936 [marine metagenome]|uniref:Uncharacterized protein n=1 Tax=marine metagenome TaxID=408172 RepID=A0A382IFP1_9ZZZZ